MWRLVVTQTEQHLSFVLCRPTRAAAWGQEDCDWRVDFQKPGKTQELLGDDQFLFSTIAALHEKMPIREFNTNGENFSRPEPRIKSTVLENPPALIRGILRFNELNNRLVVTPVSVFQEQTPAESVWMIPAGPMNQRIAIMEQLLRDSGYKPTQPPPVLRPQSKPAPPTPTPQALAASSAAPASAEIKSTPKATAPAPSAVSGVPPIPAPSQRTALKSKELAAAPTAQKSDVKGKSRTVGGRRRSIFANEEITLSDDREVTKLKGAEDEDNDSSDPSLLSEVWDVLWPGLWQATFDVSGLPVPESEQARLPSTQSFAFSAWHPIWRNLSIGGNLRHTRDSETLDLKINLPGAALFQQAQGRRKTTHLTGSVMADFVVLGGYLTRLETRYGAVFLNETWSYDRKKSTFEIWSPAGRGNLLEPALLIQPNRNVDGFSARVAYGLYRFDDARGSQLSLETGWQWGFEDDAFQWGRVKISKLQSYFGLQRGQIENPERSALPDSSGTVLLNSFWLGLRTQIDETY